MTEPGHLAFNHIYIVQSLGADELPTGTYLDRFAMQPRIEGMNRSGLPIGADVVDVKTAADLFAFLERVRKEVEADHRSPILHLEIHGSSDQTGIILRSFEFVPWQALLEPLTHINRATGHNLLVTLAVCHGAWLGRILSASRPAPFWALIGPSKSEHPVLLFPAFEAFYTTLLDDLDGREAIKDLLETATARSTTHSLSVIHSERIFARAFRQYVDEACSADAIERRVSKIILEAKQKASSLGAPFTEDHFDGMATAIRLRMADTRPMFDEYRRRFFMIDTCPENETRFSLTYEQTLALE